MCITYEIAQYSLNKASIKYIQHRNPPKKIPNYLPKPGIMPTKLVRISDMTVVDGSQVNEGYCALSYSWGQSGDILHDETTGEYKRVDEGKHKIVTYDNMFPEMIIPYHKIYGIEKLEKIYAVLNIMEENKYYFTKTTKYVKFEGIIQQICQQFNIKYIWCDQMCINQGDKEEKYREIRKMHHIYSNAYCTVALVPDYEYIQTLGDFLGNEEYFKRLWTLEEAIKSERLLFVGRNVYSWGDDIHSYFGFAYKLTRPISELNVAQILYHAHQRTSTRGHDRVFALIHLFPEFMQHINIDYNQPLEDMMIRFYGLVAKKDISILFFNSTRDSYNSTIQKYQFLPSWTGVNGKHIVTDYFTTSFQDYDIMGKTMQVTSKFVTNDRLINRGDSLTIRKNNLPPPPDNISDGNTMYSYRLIIVVQLPGTNETRKVLVSYANFYLITNEEPFEEISETLKKLSRFMEIKKENLCWCHCYGEEYQKVIDFNFSNLTEDVDNPSAQYIILSEVSFRDTSEYLFNDKSYSYYPVIKKKQGEEYYKAIGCCDIRSNEDAFSNCNLPKQTFLIQ